MPKKAAMFIAFQGFRDEEYLEPKKILEEAGIKVVTVSTSRGLARGKLGATAEVDLTADEIDPADYDALMLVGGPGTLEHLDKPKVHEIFRKAAELGKTLGAICISPVVLAHAGLLKGKKATVFPDGAAALEKGGAVYTAQDLSTDGNIVTADGPAPAGKYARALVELLKG